MDRRLIDYLPPILQNVIEFKAINAAEQPEFERAWQMVNFIMANQFLDSATEEGVLKWEKELGITPINSETLEQRKMRIKIAWTCGALYTYKWLAKWLQSFNEDNKVSREDYTLNLLLPNHVDYMNIINTLKQCVPANMLLNALVYLEPYEPMQISSSVYIHTGEIRTLQVDSGNRNYPLIAMAGESLVIASDDVIAEEVDGNLIVTADDIQLSAENGHIFCEREE